MCCYCFTKSESTPETGDSDVNPNYSLSDDSYSDSSDSNSSLLFEVNFSVLNGTQNVDLILERGNRKPNSRKRKRTIQSEWKSSKTKLLGNTGHTYRFIKRATEVPERTIRPLVVHLYTVIFSRILRTGNT